MLRDRSYGKVYKGRWRGGTVAIKVLQHGGNVALQISALRESLLCKNIMHPNIVRILGCAPHLSGASDQIYEKPQRCPARAAAVCRASKTVCVQTTSPDLLTNLQMSEVSSKTCYFGHGLRFQDAEQNQLLLSAHQSIHLYGCMIHSAF